VPTRQFQNQQATVEIEQEHSARQMDLYEPPFTRAHFMPVCIKIIATCHQSFSVANVISRVFCMRTTILCTILSCRNNNISLSTTHVYFSCSISNRMLPSWLYRQQLMTILLYVSIHLGETKGAATDYWLIAHSSHFPSPSMSFSSSEWKGMRAGLCETGR
jgi:hypothetical protein